MKLTTWRCFFPTNIAVWRTEWTVSKKEVQTKFVFSGFCAFYVLFSTASSCFYKQSFATCHFPKLRVLSNSIQFLTSRWSTTHFWWFLRHSVNLLAYPPIFLPFAFCLPKWITSERLFRVPLTILCKQKVPWRHAPRYSNPHISSPRFSTQMQGGSFQRYVWVQGERKRQRNRDKYEESRKRYLEQGLFRVLAPICNIFFVPLICFQKPMKLICR